MSLGLLVFSNLVAPLVTGLFLVLCFTYFVVAAPSNALSYRHFLVFLISFGLFSFGRPLQLVLGAHPLPLIVVNIRVFILCAAIAPSMISAADVFGSRQASRLSPAVVIAGIVLGLTYVVFNTLGTRDSYVLFEVGNLVAYDNLTPSRFAPYYGREMTIAVQFVTGMLLLLISSVRLLGLRPDRGFRSLLRDKSFLINTGILFFAMAFIAGSLAKQWWVYYAASIVTALLFGAAVLIDAKEVHRSYERLIPFIKEDIIHNVAFSEFSKSKLTDLLDCLGKEVDLDTFIVAKAHGGREARDQDIGDIDAVLEVANRGFGRLLGHPHFVLLPLSGDRVGIVLHSPEEWGSERKARTLELLEEVKEEIHSVSGVALSIGVDLMKDLGTAEQWLRRFVNEIVGGVTFRRTRRIGALISRAVAYIQTNYAQPLSYKDVAREMDISPSYFVNLFKKETGTTFVDYLTAVRIDAAKEQLLTSDLKITEIAFDVGFNSSNYFSSTFRKIVGVSAREYRAGRPRVQPVLRPAGPDAAPGSP
ncbi:MAG: helix-turn-helix transcriptional regulator [Spirochaetota bacterium]